MPYHPTKKPFHEIALEAKSLVTAIYSDITEFYEANQNQHDGVLWNLLFGTPDGSRTAGVLYQVGETFGPPLEGGPIVGRLAIPIPLTEELGPTEAFALVRKAGYEGGVDFTAISCPIRTPLQPYWLFNIPTPRSLNVLVSVPGGDVVAIH